jgi:hypothetical protein
MPYECDGDMNIVEFKAMMRTAVAYMLHVESAPNISFSLLPKACAQILACFRELGKAHADLAHRMK